MPRRSVAVRQFNDVLGYPAGPGSEAICHVHRDSPTFPSSIAMTSKTDGVAVATFTRHADAEAAVRDLKGLGFDLTQLSIVGKGYHTEEHVAGFVSTGDRVKFWGTLGAFWGALWGLLTGGAFLLIPGVGHLVVLGWLTSAIVEAAGGAAIGAGLSALGAALVSLGIPKDSVLKLESAVKADRFVLVAHGTPSEVAEVHEYLDTRAELAEVFGGEDAVAA